MLEAVRRLYAYNGETTERLLGTAADVDPDDFTALIVIGQPSIRDVFMHLCSAQSAHLATWSTLPGASPWIHEVMDPAELPHIAAVRQQWSAISAGTDAFLGTHREAMTISPDGIGGRGPTVRPSSGSCGLACSTSRITGRSIGRKLP